MLVYLNAENEYAHKAMQSTHRLQDKLFREMYTFFQSNRAKHLQFPENGGDGYLYYSRRSRGHNFPVYYRRRHGQPDGDDGFETVLLDQNIMPDFFQRQLLGDLKVVSLGGDGGSCLVAFTLLSPDAMNRGGNLYIRVVDTDTRVRPSGPPFSFYSSPSTSSWWTANGEAWTGIGGFEWGPREGGGDRARRTLYYTKVDSYGRPHQVWAVQLTEEGDKLHGAPRLLHSLRREQKAVFLSLAATKDKMFVTVSANSKSSSEVHLLPGPGGRESCALLEPRLFRKRQSGVQYFVDHGGGFFFVVTNARVTGAGKGNDAASRTEPGEYRLMLCPTADTSQWTPCSFAETTEACGDVVMGRGGSQDKGGSIEDMDLFHDHCVLYGRVGGVPALYALDRLHTTPSSLPSPPFSSFHRLSLPSEAETGRLEPGLNQDYRAHALRFSLSSPIIPDVTYEYDLKTRYLREYHREILPSRPPLRVQGNSGSGAQEGQEAYECQRQWVKNDDDHMLIPLTVARRRGLKGPLPTLLLAYGAYGVSLDLSFRPEVLALLNRGWAVAYAHVRGGGELGRWWHTQGKGRRKMNSVTDYLWCAEWLVRSGRSRPGWLVGHGSSAGALVVAGAVHRQPSLFGAMVLKVPFLDLARTMMDPALPLTVHEYEEWTDGTDPRREPALQAMLQALSPYDSLGLLSTPYADWRPESSRGVADSPGSEKDSCDLRSFECNSLPPTLLLASLADARVNYWEAAKYAAKARHVCGMETEVLLRMEGDRAHEGPIAQTEMLQEAAFEAAFMITRVGLTEGREDVMQRGTAQNERRKGTVWRRRAGYEISRRMGPVPPLVFW